MKIVKVRRVGNSNVVSIPREFEASGYAPGSSVLVEDVGGGEPCILPTDQLRDRAALRVCARARDQLRAVRNADLAT